MKKLLLSFIIILAVFTLFSCQESDSYDTEAENNAIDLDNIQEKNNAPEGKAISGSVENNQEKDEENNADMSKENDADKVANDENILNEDKNQEENTVTNEFILKAIVKDIENDRIVVEVIESDYAFGIYHILTFNTTKYLNENGSIINRQSIKIGETVEITYSGQTMLSYPPQVVAYSIKVVSNSRPN